MAEQIFVTLDALVPNDCCEDTRLVKRISPDYKDKTFHELVKYMCDGKADDLNEQPYNKEEMIIADFVQDLLQQVKLHPGSVQLYALSKDEPPQEMCVSLNDKVSDYNDRILKTESGQQDGKEIRYEKIELTIM